MVLMAAKINVIVAEFNTPAFDCGVATTTQRCNRVANPPDMGIISKWVLL